MQRRSEGRPRDARLRVLAGIVLLSLVPVPAWSAPTMPASIATLARAAPDLDPAVLALALRATSCAERRGMLASPGLLTIIDYSRPSTEPRLWVLDLTRRVLLHRVLVAHGRGSGELYATAFSNEPGSKQTSLGLFATGDVYLGEHGRSLRLHGLEPGVNDLAFARALVMHGADYVSPEFAARHGRLGRSHGCPALARDVAPEVIAAIHGGTPLFAYHPADPAWRGGSGFLAACEGAAPTSPLGKSSHGG